MEPPDHRERKALEALRFSEWESRGNLYPAGVGTITKLIQKGWIEQLPDAPSGLERFRITEAGKKALSIKAASKSKTTPKLKMLGPVLKPIDSQSM